MRTAPAYARIKADILGRIRAGDWPPGHLLPGEVELAQRYGCARMTVHRALRELADEGVVERRKRAGTRVAMPTGRSAMFDIPRVDMEIEAMGASYRYARLARRLETPPEAVRSKLGLPEGERTVHLTCLHFANEAPFQLEERWINLAVAPQAADEPFDTQGPNLWLLDRLPWSEVEHVVSAVNASIQHAQRLELSPGDALLLVERRTWIEQTVITYARFYHPGRFYRLYAKGGYRA